MENKVHLPESGEPFEVEECSRCQAQPAKGVKFIRAGIEIFKCGECGKGMNLGYLESTHKQQLEGKLGHEKATENRDRFWRENQEKQNEEFERLKREPGAEPEKAWNIDFATRKWRFDRPSHLP